MDLSKEEAQDSLNQIEAVFARTRKAIASGSASALLILWGAIWVAGYLSIYAFTPRAAEAPEYPRFSLILTIIWAVLILIGVVDSWIIGVRKSPTKSPHNQRLGFFWFFLFVYANVWLVLLWPWNHYQMQAFVAALVMFAYVVMGLWFDRFLLWLGLAVTTLIVLGYFLFLFQPTFWLWMAVMGGGTLMTTGLYIRKAWR